MDSFAKHFPRAVQLAQQIIESRLRPGDLAVDATVGNGHDTLFLAKLVGEAGRVIGFDIQESAIARTCEKTTEYRWVDLHLAGHETVASHLDRAPRVAMFNLGYLPGSDKDIVTSSTTTVRALEVITARLLNSGVITIVIYTGHDGGPEEASEIQEWCSGLDQNDFTVVEYCFVNQKNSPPSLIAIERK